MKGLNLCIVLISMMIFSCNNTIETVNDSVDIEKGKILTEKFYANLKVNDLERILKMIPNQKNKNDLKKAIEDKQILLGSIESKEIVYVESKRIEKNDSTFINYSIGVKVEYSNKNSEEILEFKTINDNNELTSYRFNFEGAKRD